MFSPRHAGQQNNAAKFFLIVCTQPVSVTFIKTINS